MTDNKKEPMVRMTKKEQTRREQEQFYRGVAAVLHAQGRTHIELSDKLVENVYQYLGVEGVKTPMGVSITISDTGDEL